MIRLDKLPALLLLPLAIACGEDAKESNTDDTGTGDTEDTGDTGTDDTADTGPDDTDTGDTGDTAPPAGIAIIGDWVDNWGGTHNVSDTEWRSDGSLFEISAYVNGDEANSGAGYAIAQNGADNSWNPGMWSRFDWGWSDGELLYCQTAYAAATEADALATPAADLSSPASGCGGFSWSVLRAPFPLTGGWDDSWGGTHAIDAFTWASGDATFSIAEVDAAAGWAVAQNGADNGWNPELWSRFEWTQDGAGAVWYCQAVYDAATEAEARAAAPADAADLLSGCGGFSWTELRRTLPINGAWVDGWGGTHDITAFVWVNDSSRYDISQTDATAWLVAQNGSDNAWNPGMWSRFDWTWDGDGLLWYCQTAYAAATEADALATPAADATDPATTGCGSFPWTSMEAR